MSVHERLVEAIVAEAGDRAGRRIDGPGSLFAVVDERWPRSHDNNKVVAPAPVPADVLLDFADEALASSGVPFRQILALFEDEAVPAAAKQAGYDVSRILLMELPPTVGATPDPAIDVRAVDEPTVRALLEESWRADAPQYDAETVRQLVSRRDASPSGAVTPLVAFADGVPVAHADLRVRGTVAEVDTVGTLPAYRNRGFAGALTLSAAARGRADGADLVFLQADADDWPRDLYARLGFVAIGAIIELHRPAP